MHPLDHYVCVCVRASMHESKDQQAKRIEKKWNAKNNDDVVDSGNFLTSCANQSKTTSDTMHERTVYVQTQIDDDYQWLYVCIQQLQAVASAL